MMIKKIVFFLIFLTAFFYLDTANILKAEEELYSNKADSYSRYMPPSNIKAAQGGVSITEAESEYSHYFKVAGKLPIKLSIDAQYIGIKDDVAVELPSRLTGNSFDFETTLPFFNFDKTYFRFGLSPSFYTDDWDFDASAFRIPSRYFFIWQPKDNLTFIAGVAVYPDYDTSALPIAGFIYKPSEKWLFNIVPKRPSISYKLNDKTTVFTEGGGAINSEFEVTRGNQKNVVLKYKETRLGAGVKYKFNSYIKASVQGGEVFGRTLKYLDGAGKVNIKQGAYAELRVIISM